MRGLRRKSKLRVKSSLDFDAGRGECSELLHHSLTQTREHGGAAGQHDIRVQIPTQINVAAGDGLSSGLVDPVPLLPDERRVEQGLHSPEPLVPNGCDLKDDVRRVSRLVFRREGVGTWPSGMVNSASTSDEEAALAISSSRSSAV